MNQINYKPGEIIIEEGTFGDSAYILKGGSVEVRKKTEKGDLTLAELQAEDIFGELGLIEDKPRSASIVAKTDVRVDEITREDFYALLDDKASFVIPILRAFFERLRQTNDLVVRLENQLGSGQDEEQPESGLKTVRMRGLTAEASQVLNDKEVVIKKFPFKIGRQSHHRHDDIFVDNDLYINDEIPYNVSKNHLSINYGNRQFYILDRGSSLGTIVNNEHYGGKISNFKAILKRGENRVSLGAKDSPFQFKVIVA